MPAACTTREATGPVPPVSKGEQVRAELLAPSMTCTGRRADLMSEGSIVDHVALHWLEWNGGASRRTGAAANACQQPRARSD